MVKKSTVSTEKSHEATAEAQVEKSQTQVAVVPPIQKPEKKDKGVKPANAKPKLDIYIHRLLKKVDTDGYSLAKSTVLQISIMMMSFARTLANRSAQLINKVTVDERAVCFAARSLLDEHHLSVCSRGYKAMEDYKATLDKMYKDTMPATTRAGLVLPPSLFRRLLCKVGKRVSLTAPVLFAGMMEELMSTILLAAKGVAAAQGDKRLTMSHVMAGVEATPLLKHIMDKHVHTVIPGIPKGAKKSRALQLQMLPFKRLCVTILEGLDKENSRFSADFFHALQRYIEAYIVQQFIEADHLARHANRKGLKEKDVKVLMSIHPSVGKSGASMPPVKSMESGMRRLARAAGLGPVAPGALSLMQKEMHAHLTTVLNATSMVAKSQRLKTLSVAHLREGLSLQGVCFV